MGCLQSVRSDGGNRDYGGAHRGDDTGRTGGGGRWRWGQYGGRRGGRARAVRGRGRRGRRSGGGRWGLNRGRGGRAGARRRASRGRTAATDDLVEELVQWGVHAIDVERAR